VTQLRASKLWFDRFGLVPKFLEGELGSLLQNV
jgi:hypothetical protein